MRLLQLDMGRSEILDLHPNMTVVHGLDEAGRRLLADSVRGLARSETSTEGLLEAHGVLFELRSELLDLLELTLPEIEPVVLPGDLPTQPLTVDGRELKARQQEFSELLEAISAQAQRQSLARDAVSAASGATQRAREALARHESGGDRPSHQIDELTGRLEELARQLHRLGEEQRALAASSATAEQVLREAEEQRDAARARAREALARSVELEAEREALAVDLSPDAAAELDEARARLMEVTAAVEAERASAEATATTQELFEERTATAEPAQVQLERLEARLGELGRSLAALEAGDATDVEEALATVQTGGSGDLVPSAEAAVLAEDLEALARELGSDDAELVVEGSLGDARARLDHARHSLLEAEQAARSLHLDPDEVDRLEVVHERLLEAIERADGRFAGVRARDRVDRLREEERDILDRLGFASHSDYMMGSSRVSPDPARLAAVAEAKAELAAAEEAWRDVEQATDAALARAALLDRRRPLVEQARRLLDPLPPVDQLPGALRLVRVPAVSAEQAAERLRTVLERHGLDLGDEDIDVEEVTLIAEAWLAEASSTHDRLRALRREQADLLAEEPELRAAAASDPPGDHALTVLVPDPDLVPDPADATGQARLADAEAAVRAAEERWLAHEVAADRLEALAPRLAAAVDAAVEAGKAEEAAGSEVESARGALAVLRARAQHLSEQLVRIEGQEAEARTALEATSTEALDPADLAAAVDAAEAGERDAELALEAETRRLATLDSEAQAVAIEIERLEAIVASQASGGAASEAEELEWYLLARLAAQRSVSVAGSLPMLLDDALRGLDAAGVSHLLGRLERMAEAVQVIVVSEDPVVAEWAHEAGPARAAVVRPSVP